MRRVMLTAGLVLLVGAFVARPAVAARKKRQPGAGQSPAAAAPTASPRPGPSDDALFGINWDNPNIDYDILRISGTGEPDRGEVPVTVHFTVESMIADTMQELKPKIRWDFGDGSPVSQELNPTHTYQKPGTYTARVKVIDGIDRRGYDDVEITVLEVGGLQHHKATLAAAVLSAKTPTPVGTPQPAAP